MTKAEETLIEIDTLLATFAAPHEGLRDYAHLVLSNHTLEEVNKSIGLYDRRVNALVNARNAIRALMADGHPLLPIRAIGPQEYAEILNNAATIEAAKATFASNAARDLTLTGGEVEDKR